MCFVSGVVDAKPKEPVWKEEESQITPIGPDGGEVSAGRATIKFRHGALKRVHGVKLQHQRPSERQQPEDVLIKIEEEEVQLGDRVVLSIDPQSTSKLEPTGAQPVDLCTGASNAAPKSSDMVVDIPVDVPPSKPIADLYASSQTEEEDASDYRRVTDSVGLKLEDKSRGEKHLTFNAAAAIAGFASKAASTVFEVVWSKSKAAANKASSAVAQFFASDKKPLHIRVHYRCDSHGYPNRLQTIIAAGSPPQLADKDKCDDWWYTARGDGGEKNLKDKLISCRDHVRVQIEPFNPTPAWKMTKSREYTFTKPPRGTDCNYYYHGMGLFLDQVQSTAEHEWEVMITVLKNDQVIGKGNSVVLIQKQVRRLHVCKWLSKFVVQQKSLPAWLICDVHK